MPPMPSMEDRSYAFGSPGSTGSPAQPPAPAAPPAAAPSSKGPRSLRPPVHVREATTLEPYVIVAASPTEVVFRYDGWGAVPREGEVLTLVSEEHRFSTVRMFARIAGLTETTSGTRLLRARWIALTARERRAYLVSALRVILGLNARTSAQDDALGPHRKLVFDARTQQVRLANASEPILTEPAAPSSGLASPLSPTGAPASIVAQPVPPAGPGSRTDTERRPTQPRILVGTARRPTPADALATPTRPTPRPQAAPPRRLTNQFQQIADYTRGGTTTQGRREPRPMPVFRRATGRGLFTWSGQAYPMLCGLIGESHLVFVAEGLDAPALGMRLDVGVPGDPILNEGDVITVTGQVSLVTAEPRGRVFVEVDLTASDIPQRYLDLVRHWGGVSRGR